MMAAILKKKQTTNEWYCSECMMRQRYLRPQCFFCGSIFSNLEEALLDDYQVIEENKRKEAIENEIRRDE